MISDILARIEQRLKATGMTAAAASRAATGSPDAIRDIRRAIAGKHTKRTGVSTTTLAKLAVTLGTTPEWLLTGYGEAKAGPTTAESLIGARNAQEELIPIIGMASGALAVGKRQAEEKPIDAVPLAPALRGAHGIYGVYIANDSMAPEHKEGDLRIIHPGKPPRPGDSVLIHVKANPSAPAQVYIKRFVRNTDNALICEQINPPAQIEYRKDYVLAVHKVLTINEIFGV